MSRKNKQFLDIYRELETELKATLNTTVLDYESKLSPPELQERLKICRVMRNYLTHAELDFIEVTDKQLTFLEKQTEKIARGKLVAKDKAKKAPLQKEGCTIKATLPILNKFGYAPIQTAKGVVLYSKDDAIYDIANEKKKVEIRKNHSHTKVPTIAKTTPLETLAPGVYVVTENGKVDGKYVGVLKVD